jgi:hypothetical protein
MIDVSVVIGVSVVINAFIPFASPTKQTTPAA